jgi:hypothetical protein
MPVSDHKLAQAVALIAHDLRPPPTGIRDQS